MLACDAPHCGAFDVTICPVERLDTDSEVVRRLRYVSLPYCSSATMLRLVNAIMRRRRLEKPPTSVHLLVLLLVVVAAVVMVVCRVSRDAAVRRMSDPSARVARSLGLRFLLATQRTHQFN